MELAYREFEAAGDFLLVTGAFLKSDPVLNGLMLGVAERLVKDPRAYGGLPPYFGVVEYSGGIELAALMTPPHRLQLLSSSAECPAEGVRLLASRLHAGKRPVPGVLARRDLGECFGAAWSALTGGAFAVGIRQRVHELRRVNALPPPPGRLLAATAADLDLVLRWGREFHAECFGNDAASPDNSEKTIRSLTDSGRLFLWHDGRPRSMAARARPVADGESISYVYTPPAERGRGYATAAVAGLASLILSEGKAFCSLYTDLANPTSNKIYRRIGFMPRADVVNVDFKAAVSS
jgi:GNAT superfamily N-acetyltransferase